MHRDDLELHHQRRDDKKSLIPAKTRSGPRYSVLNSRVVYVANSEEQAWNDTRDALMYQAELYGKWLSAAAGSDPSRAMIRPDPERLRRTSILGSPEEVHRFLSGPVLRKNISLRLEPRIVLRDLEETASAAEGRWHDEGRVELAEDSG